MQTENIIYMLQKKYAPIDKKYVNLQYITLGCLDDGSSTKSLMFQVLFFLYYL